MAFLDKYDKKENLIEYLLYSTVFLIICCIVCVFIYSNSDSDDDVVIRKPRKHHHFSNVELMEATYNDVMDSEQVYIDSMLVEIEKKVKRCRE